MAYMRRELVERERLVDDGRYLEGVAVVKLLPGPVSTLLSVFLGNRIAGTVGGLLSVLCYIFPAFLMMLLIAWGRDHIDRALLESAGWKAFMTGLQVAVIAIVLQTCWKLFSEAVRKSYAGIPRPIAAALIALGAAVLAYLHVPEPLVLVGAACVGVAVLARRPAGLRVDPVTLFFTFLWAGLTVFGTGYMVIPHLQRVLVETHGWISATDFLDGVAWGNLTPGPIVIASTYWGFIMGGWSNAMAATLGIFCGPIVLMMALEPFVRRAFGKPWIEGALLGLIPSVASTIAVGMLSLVKAIAWGPAAAVVFAVGLVGAFRGYAAPVIFATTGLLMWTLSHFGF